MESDNLDFNWELNASDLPGDLFGRAKYARFLSFFLASKGKEENFVLNINASWGAGKTWFLRRWADEVKYTYPVVFIDAWKSDHSKDPFLAVISSIVNDLEKMVDSKYVESTLTKKSWLLIKSIAPEVTKGIIKKYLGTDCDEISRAIEKDDEGALANIGSKIVSDLIKLHDTTNNTIDEFKVAVSNYLGCIEAEKKLSLPLFVFIDELDRCRPTYAIEMLETIKHIFDMERVVFVVATDKSQLQHSIKAVYGSGFDSARYLDRFFDRSVTLKQFSLKDFISNRVANSNIFEKYFTKKDNFWFYNSNCNNINKVCGILSDIGDSLAMDLRTANHWLDRLEAILSNDIKKIEIIYMSFLLALYSKSQVLYDDFISSVFTSTDEIQKFTKSNIDTGKIRNTNIDIEKQSIIDIIGMDEVDYNLLNVKENVNVSYMSYVF
ncbi:P-loop NTPase fold protein, partial [Serratia marcescens]